jgi:hypothetical protein
MTHRNKIPKATPIFSGTGNSMPPLCRRRASDPYFDDECCAEKRHVRQLEWEARRANSINAAASANATTAWTTRRRSYRDLLRRKRESFWQTKVNSERSSPRQLWRSIDALMGRGRRLSLLSFTSSSTTKWQLYACLQTMHHRRRSPPFRRYACLLTTEH